MAYLFPPDFSPFSIQTNPSENITLSGLKGGTGPPLLLIHGFPQTHLIWHKVAPTLMKHYVLIMPDIRGYGTSSKPKSSDPNNHTLYAKSHYALDLATLMKALGFNEYYVVGHDRGARIAHKLAIDHPASVKKVMFLDVVPTLTMFNGTDQAFATKYWHWFFLIQPSPFPENAITSAPRVFLQKFLAGLPVGKTTAGEGKENTLFAAEAMDAWEATFKDWDTVHGMCEDYRAAASVDLDEQREDIKHGRKIQCPVRALWGAAGMIEAKFDGRADWQAVSQGVVDEKSRALDSGHYIPEEVPDVLCEDILEFCR